MGACSHLAVSARIQSTNKWCGGSRVLLLLSTAYLRTALNGRWDQLEPRQRAIFAEVDMSTLPPWNHCKEQITQQSSISCSGAPRFLMRAVWDQTWLGLNSGPLLGLARQTRDPVWRYQDTMNLGESASRSTCKASPLE